jgi:hypothetical protein
MVDGGPRTKLKSKVVRGRKWAEEGRNIERPTSNVEARRAGMNF